MWKRDISGTISPDYEQLYGGNSNVVLRKKNTDELVILWRETHRWFDLMRAVVTEDVMASQMGIPGRRLRDSSVPLEIFNGYLATRAYYVEGQYAYPWNDQQIASAANMMGRLHVALQGITFDRTSQTYTDGHQLIHADLGRGNILFTENRASGVIDYEFMTRGPREQNIGRTLSLLYVDAKIHGRDPTPDHSEDLIPVFNRKTRLLLDNYPLPYDEREVIQYTLGYLMFDKYGTLDHVRDMALEWVRRNWNIPQSSIPGIDIFIK